MKLWITLALLFLQKICLSAEPDTLLIGKIATHPDWKMVVYLIEPVTYRQIHSSFEGHVIDSAAIESDGSFFFLKKNGASKKLLRLTVQRLNSRFPNKIEPFYAENCALIVLPAAHTLHFSASMPRLAASYFLKNADADNQILMNLRNLRQPLFEKLATDPAGKLLEPLSDFDLERTRLIVQKNIAPRLRHFLDTCRHFLPAFAALQFLNPQAEYGSDRPFFLKINYLWTSLAADELPNWVSDYHQRMKQLTGAPQVGDIFPSKIGADSIDLFQKMARLRIVFFWTSWQREARQCQQSVLKDLFLKFEKKGLSVVGISADNRQVDFETAISADQLTWHNLRLVGGRNDDLLFDLEIEDFPTVFLLDGEGKILARNLPQSDWVQWVVDFFEK